LSSFLAGFQVGKRGEGTLGVPTTKDAVVTGRILLFRGAESSVAGHLGF